MAAFRSIDRASALRLIPASPTTIEFRAIALDPRGTIARSGSGLLLADPYLPVIGAMGRVDAGDFEAFIRWRGIACEVVADRAAYDALREKREFERATIATLAGRWRPPPVHVPGLTVRLLEPNDSLAHVPSELRDELVAQRTVRPVHVGFIAGVAVGFGYVYATETLADISIDTLEDYRRRGVALAVVSRVIDDCFASGKTPVWGALKGNQASLGLAAKLGFTRYAGELYVAERLSAVQLAPGQ